MDASGRTNVVPSILPSLAPESEPPPLELLLLLAAPELLAVPELLVAPELLAPPLLDDPAPLLLPPPELAPELEPPLPEALASLSSPASEAPPLDVLDPLQASKPTATSDTNRAFMLSSARITKRPRSTRPSTGCYCSNRPKRCTSARRGRTGHRPPGAAADSRCPRSRRRREAGCRCKARRCLSRFRLA